MIYHKLIDGCVLNNYELGEITPEEAYAQGYKTLTKDPEEEGKFYEISGITETEHNIHLSLVEVEDPSIPEKEVEKEFMRQMRAEAYKEEKDPITCHIESLKDEEQTPETQEEISELKQERAEVVENIKERYPYPEEQHEETE
jgi:hypothetical protein